MHSYTTHTHPRTHPLTLAHAHSDNLLGELSQWMVTVTFIGALMVSYYTGSAGIRVYTVYVLAVTRTVLCLF